MISPGLYRFLAIAVLLGVKNTPQVGPLEWGRIGATLDLFGKMEGTNIGGHATWRHHLCIGIPAVRSRDPRIRRRQRHLSRDRAFTTGVYKLGSCAVVPGTYEKALP